MLRSARGPTEKCCRWLLANCPLCNSKTPGGCRAPHMTCGKKILKQGEVEDEVDVDRRE